MIASLAQLSGSCGSSAARSSSIARFSRIVK
jgi:hypothetical protein